MTAVEFLQATLLIKEGANDHQGLSAPLTQFPCKDHAGWSRTPGEPAFRASFGQHFKEKRGVSNSRADM